MNKEQIIDKIKKYLEKQIGEKHEVANTSHMSQSVISPSLRSEKQQKTVKNS